MRLYTVKAVLQNGSDFWLACHAPSQGVARSLVWQHWPELRGRPLAIELVAGRVVFAAGGVITLRRA